MDLKVREIDERDLNFIGIILNDLYSSLNKEYTENIFVVEDEYSRNYVVKEDEFSIIYQPYYDGKEQTYKKILVLKADNIVYDIISVENYYQQLIDEVSYYLINRPHNHSKIYFKNS